MMMMIIIIIGPKFKTQAATDTSTTNYASVPYDLLPYNMVSATRTTVTSTSLSSYVIRMPRNSCWVFYWLLGHMYSVRLPYFRCI